MTATGLFCPRDIPPLVIRGMRRSVLGVGMDTTDGAQQCPTSRTRNSPRRLYRRAARKTNTTRDADLDIDDRFARNGHERGEIISVRAWQSTCAAVNRLERRLRMLLQAT